MTARRKLTVSARIAAIILKGAAKFGVSESRLIRETRFDPNLLHDPDARIPLEQENALWMTAADLAEDAAFGLHVAEMIQPGMFDVLDYVVRTAPTLRAAVDRLARYNRLMHDVAEFKVEDLPEGVLIHHRFRTPDLVPVRHAAEFTLASLLVIARQMAGRLPLVVSVSFAHTAPEDTAEHRRIFGFLPAFSAHQNVLLLTADSMLAPVPAADPALSRIVTSHADQLLRKLSISAEDCLASRVRQVVLAGLAEGNATIGEAARQLCMSERSLQRALQTKGTTFNAVFDEVRKRAALDFIADSNIALGEIAYLIGFSEPSAFHRAFKRWTGLTPLAARQASRTKAS